MATLLRRRLTVDLRVRLRRRMGREACLRVRLGIVKHLNNDVMFDNAKTHTQTGFSPHSPAQADPQVHRQSPT
ncbi:hypothetical protein GBF38_009249 [Nibea albiflora]|uniref:Uncharacterized protein n=1 Tax=Nibea albiflora TaxID=240163 RepID=A0ACB7ERA9_NIBAL|nr:hypothetical protein GBF38_009249 [Nibea albiflora]